MLRYFVMLEREGEQPIPDPETIQKQKDGIFQAWALLPPQHRAIVTLALLVEVQNEQGGNWLEEALLSQDSNKDKEFPWGVDELEARAGALVNEALANWPGSVKRAHWEDMKQTAMMTLLEHQDKPASYGYAVARNALKNYKWIHIRGLNGGWKSLVARNYTVSDIPLEEDGYGADQHQNKLFWQLAKAQSWDRVLRPVEWIVLARLTEVYAATEDIFRELLYILAGMSNTNWYPEQIYRAALIISMLLDGYTWEDVEQRTNLDFSEVWEIWWHYRKTRLSPYVELTPLHREIIKMLGQTRLVYFEELSLYWLNQPQRKMVVFEHGIYTITYKRRGRRPNQSTGLMEASLQKGRSVNGRPVVLAVSLGRVGEITKERLLESSHQLESKFLRLHNTPGSLGKMSQSRQMLFNPNLATSEK